MSHSKIENLPDEMHQRFHLLLDKINGALSEVFPDFGAENLALVLGVQWGGMGGEEHPEWPSCLVTSNLPECLVSDALVDMADAAEAIHKDYHGVPEEEPLPGMTERDLADLDALSMEVDPSEVPQEVRDFAQRFAESMGLTAEDVEFRHVVDTADLDALPTFVEPERGEN